MLWVLDAYYTDPAQKHTTTAGYYPDYLARNLAVTNIKPLATLNVSSPLLLESTSTLAIGLHRISSGYLLSCVLMKCCVPRVEARAGAALHLVLRCTRATSLVNVLLGVSRRGEKTASVSKTTCPRHQRRQ